MPWTNNPTTLGQAKPPEELEFYLRSLSHSPSAGRSRKMLLLLEPMRATLDGISLSVEQLIELPNITRRTE